MVNQIECFENAMEDQLDRDYQAAIKTLMSRAAAAGEHDMTPAKSTGRADCRQAEEQAVAEPQAEPAAPVELPRENVPETPRRRAQWERQSRAVETSNQLQALRRVANAVAANSVNAHLLRRRRKVKRELIFSALLASLALLALANCLLNPLASISPSRAAYLGLAVAGLCVLTVIHCVVVMRKLDQEMLSAPELSEVGQTEPPTALDSRAGLPGA